MSFERMRLIVAVVLGSTMVAASGCSLKLNDPVPAQKPDSLTKELEECLSGYKTTFQNFFAGTLEEGQMSRLLGCFGTALALFQENFRGESDAGFGKDKLKVFLEKTFLKNEVIDPALFSHAMRLKQAVLGGTTDVLSPAEISRTRELISAVGGPLDELRTAFPLDWVSLRRRAPADIETSLNLLEQVAEAVGEVFGRYGQYYEFDEFAQLVDAFLEVAYPGEKRGSLRKILESGIIQSLKAALVSKPGTALTSADWRTVFPVAARVYGIVSRADVLLNGPGGLGSATYRMLSQRLMGQALEVIRNSVERRALKEIPLLEFTDILWQVKDHNWLTLPDSFGRTPEDFSRSMFLFWGGVTHAMTGRAIRVVNLEVLDRIQALSDAVHQSIDVLAPYWPLTEENLANLDSNQIQQAARALESAGRLLAGAFSPAQPAGDEFLELPSLVSMIVPAHLRTRLDWQVVQQIRSLILPRAQSGVAPGDWQRLAEVASRVWSLFVRYHYAFHGPVDWSENPNLDLLSQTIHESANLFGEIANQLPGQTLTLDKISDLLEIAHTKQWFKLPEGMLSEPGLRSNVGVFAGLLGRIRSKDFSGGFNAQAVHEVVQLADQWFVGQRAFLQARQALGRAPATAQAWADQLGSSEAAIVFRRLAKPHLGWPDRFARVGWWDGGMAFPSDSRDLDPEFVENVKNASFVLMRLVDGFVTTPATRANYAGMNLLELNDAYGYLEPVLKGIGLLKSTAISTLAEKKALAVSAAPYLEGGMERLQSIFPMITGENPKPGANPFLLDELLTTQAEVGPGALRRFREVRAFTLVSQPYSDPENPPFSNDARLPNSVPDADPPMISLPAGAVYLVGWAGAAQQAKKMIADFVEGGSPANAIPAAHFRSKIVDPAFMAKHWGRRYPEWVAHINGLQANRRNQVARTLAQVAFGETEVYDADSSLWVIHMIVQFIETLFARFDVAPHNGELTLNEMDMAFPLYESELRRMLIESNRNPNHARLLMGYILHKGHAPGLDWLFWENRQLEGVRGMRHQVVEVFGLMSAQTTPLAKDAAALDGKPTEDTGPVKD